VHNEVLRNIFFVKCADSGQVKENEMGRACSMHWGRRRRRMHKDLGGKARRKKTRKT
jgi:hypothetical protein